MELLVRASHLRQIEDAEARDRELILERIEARHKVYARARGELLHDISTRFKTINPLYAERVQLNNAALLARRVYATDLDVFDLIYEKERRDMQRTIGRIITLAKARRDNPFGALRAWIDE